MGEDYYNSENPNKALGIVIPKHLGVFGFQLTTLHNMKGKSLVWLHVEYKQPTLADVKSSYY